MYYKKVKGYDKILIMMVSGIEDSEAICNMVIPVGRLRRWLLNNTLCNTRYNVCILQKKIGVSGNSLL